MQTKGWNKRGGGGFFGGTKDTHYAVSESGETCAIWGVTFTWEEP